MIEATTSSAAETHELAARLAQLLRPGDVLLLGGDLGAGKTTFTQGIGRGLGVAEQVTSPTFTLVHEYDPAPGKPRLVHADIYRLESLAEVADLGLPEIVDEGTVVVVEWGSRAAPALGADHLEIELVLGKEGQPEDTRMLRFRTAGRRWVDRTAALAAALAPWREAA